MKTFKVKIKGDSALMHHRFTDESVLQLLAPKTAKKKVKEDRTPRQIAEDYAYKTKDGGFYIPLGYVSGAFANVAGEYKQTNSKKSYKSIAAGIFRPTEDTAILKDFKGKPLKDFEVDIRKAVNFKAGAIAVCRPRFDEWQTEFHVELEDDLIDPAMALQILQDSGRRAGIGSFRVAKGGPFGRFSVTEWTELK